LAPSLVGDPDTVQVPDTDRYCVELAERAMMPLNGPMTRPWGLRMASLADPAGHVWELAS
jgi:uncharacterized glyoxalase superfamily protein PhnB